MNNLSQTIDSSKGFVKRQALKHLPDWALTPLRKRHYLSVLRQLSENYDSNFIVLRHLVNPGDVVIDLGAHVGACTKFLSDLVGKTGVVYSVEPFPLNFEILQQNVAKLGLSNVQLINCAVSEMNGRMTMEVPTFDEFGESFYDARLIPSGATSSLRHAAVEVATVDSLFANRPGPTSFIKCDVEGQELPTLRGARRLIEGDKPLLLLEISLMDHSTHEDVRQFLADYNYQEFCFEKGCLRLWQPGDKPVDVFFLQPAHFERARLAGLM